MSTWQCIGQKPIQAICNVCTHTCCTVHQVHSAPFPIHSVMHCMLSSRHDNVLVRSSLSSPPLTDHLLPMLANDTRWVLRSWHMCCSPALSLHWKVIQSFCLTLTHVCSQALSLVKSGSAESYKAIGTYNWWHMCSNINICVSANTAAGFDTVNGF